MPKIMVVDDDPAGQRLMKYMLGPEGYEVITASNGLMGLQMATQQSPDLIILDVMLPGLDGFEVCRRLRASAKTSKIPIIMISGKAQASDKETGLKMGANEYMVKPVERQSLVDVVNRMLSEVQKETSQAKIFAFIGARGGAGTSTVTTNVSVSLEKSGESTILVDMNPSYGALADMMGLKTEKSIAGLLKDASGTIDVDELKGMFVQHDTGVKLLWAESYPEESDSYDREDIHALFYELGNMAKFVIADVPASPTDSAIGVLNLADYIILVINARKEPAERMEVAISRLERFGINRDKLRLVAVDRTGNTEDEISVGDILGRVPVIGIIHYCKDECSAAEAEGTPVFIYSPSSQVAEDIKNLSTHLVSLE